MHSLAGLPWTIEAAELTGPGLKVLNFHPIHIWLNTNSLSHYESLKGQGSLRDATIGDLPAGDLSQPGAGLLLANILSALQGKQTYTVTEYSEQWQSRLAK